MWVMTTTGFYSVIAFNPAKAKADVIDKIPAPPEDVLVLRCRVEADMEAFVKIASEFTYGPIPYWRDDRADYMFRAFVTRSTWAAFLARQTHDLDYGNFKNEVTKQQGHPRHDVYMRVWTALLSLQPSGSTWGRRGRSKGKNRPAGQRSLPLPPPMWEDSEDPDEDFIRWMEREGDRPLRASDLIGMTDAEFHAFEAEQ